MVILSVLAFLVVGPKLLTGAPFAKELPCFLQTSSLLFPGLALILPEVFFFSFLEVTQFRTISNTSSIVVIIIMF